MKAMGMVVAFLVCSCTCGLPSMPQTSQPSQAGEAEQNTAGIQEGAGTHRPVPYEFGWQVTVIPQSLFPFHSPYAGPNSFQSRGQTEMTDTCTLFLGTRITRSKAQRHAHLAGLGVPQRIRQRLLPDPRSADTRSGGVTRHKTS
jgi:hypothetical protein